MESLRRFDLYQKADETFRVRTLSGALVSVVCIVISVVLFMGEFYSYLEVTRVDTLHVDDDKDMPLSIFLDITFPGMPCSELHLDSEESTGNQQIDIHRDLIKVPVHEKQPASRQQAVLMVRRLEVRLKSIEEQIQKEEIVEDDVLERVNKVRAKVQSLKDEYDWTDNDYKAGGVPENYCGSCYGAGKPDECCNTCDHVREAYKDKRWVLANEASIEQCVREKKENEKFEMTIEGCNIVGHMNVQKVNGNFHFAPGSSSKEDSHNHAHHVHEFSIADLTKFNVSHQINQLSFGPDFPRMVNPLSGTKNILPTATGSGLYRYYLKVVPTTYYTYEGEVVHTNQYSVTQHFKPTNFNSGSFSIPGVFFVYELSPIAMTLRETSMSVFGFLTKVCSIVGGVVAVAGLVDGFIYHSHKRIKETLGKRS
eukprot:c26293_g1_i1.p2 GENE.c26293_g1_i1~~c26293_g1_i1.p2  ORF type:complete len:424 (+),score=107.89 c26293_g1_i1:47-1318(+)